jgi:bifunctional isochorismate lyase/aryl carrier protein
MGVPVIAPYPMPVESDLPANRADWRPDPRRAVLLIHDMQRYFVNFFPPDRPVTDLARNIRLIRRTAVEAGVPVVYTAQPGGMTRQERGLLHDIWGPGMSTNAADRRILDEIAPQDNDVVLTKWRYSAFHRSELEQLIRGAGRDQLIVCGVYAHVGCLMTACDAFTRDIEPFLVADAVADFSAREHRMALDYAAQRCAVVLSTRQATAGLRRVSAEPSSSVHAPTLGIERRDRISGRVDLRLGEPGQLHP